MALARPLVLRLVADKALARHRSSRAETGTPPQFEGRDRNDQPSRSETTSRGCQTIGRAVSRSWNRRAADNIANGFERV
eukprot:10771721-Alexandrium_andersonii.AAC.1